MRLEDPAARREALRAIAPNRESARANRQLLLSIFEEEMKYRKRDTEWDYFENIYWCALLLYLAGDVSDVPLIWKAKHTNMDTGIGMDGQCLVGAGVEATVRMLKATNQSEILSYVEGMDEFGDLDDLAGWERSRIQYFYGDSA